MILVVMSWPVQSCRVSLMGSFDSTSACAAPAAPRPTASARPAPIPAPSSLLRSVRMLRPSRSESFRSEEHTSELQSLMRISYAVFCLKQKKKTHKSITHYDNTNNNTQRQLYQ